MRDYVGNELEKGDIVTYSATSYKQARLTIGEIVEVTPGGIKVKVHSRSWGWKRDSPHSNAIAIVGNENMLVLHKHDGSVPVWEKDDA